MACVTACPSGVQYGPLVERTRAQIERHYQRSLADRLFRAALFSLVPYPRPAARRARAAGGSRPGGPRLRPLAHRRARCRARAARAALARAARVVGVADRPRSPSTPAVGAQRLKVGLLTGCVQRLVFPHVNARDGQCAGRRRVRRDRAGRAGVLRRAGAPRRTARRGARLRATADRRLRQRPESTGSSSTPPAAGRR